MTSGPVKHEDCQTVTWKTQTNAKTHDVVRANLHKSIHIREEVRGPRYCPSLESKIIKFGHKQSHTVWLEPEGFKDDTGQSTNFGPPCVLSGIEMFLQISYTQMVCL